MSQRDRIEDSYPLTPTQEGMLFESLAAPEQDGYVSQLSCALVGDLDGEAFEAAWQGVVDRHPALRTAFVWQGGKRPLQVVGRRVGVPFERRDLSDLEPARRAAAFAALCADERARGFKLSRAPLMRLVLVRLAAREHRLIWTQHHLILDGWSLGVVLGEVFRIYADRVVGRSGELPPARRFRDYVAWLAARSLPAAEAFWRPRLAGLPAFSPLAVGRVDAPPQQAFGAIERHVGAQATGELVAFARGHSLTPATLAVGAWAQLLGRYTGREEAIFGNVVAGRPAEIEGVEGMVGLFVNTLATRVATPFAARALPWLIELQGELLAQREFEHTPLSEVRRWSGIEAGRPLFDSGLAFQNLGLDRAAEAAPTGLAIGEVMAEETPPFPLSVTISPGRSLGLRLGYDRRRFPPTATARLLGHFETLLIGLVHAGERPLGELPLLQPEEAEQVLGAWSRAEVEATREGASIPSVFELFARQAAATPEADAAIAGDHRLSFAELARRAKGLARRLRAAGVGPEVRVALCVERMLPMPVGMLGILAAGGAFVPLDPTYPPERIAFLLADSGAAVLVTEERWRGILPPFAGPILELDEANDRQDDPEEEGVILPIVPAESAAYVIYTSGSTGRPKGVMVSHRALAGYAQEMIRQLGLTAADRVLQFAALGFDVVLEELFPAWLAGAAVVLHGRDLLLSVGDLESVITRFSVTGLELPAAYWHEWVRELGARGARPPETLAWLIVGSEKPAPERVEAWRRFGVPLIYIFGLTETTVTSTLHRVAPGAEPRPDGSDLPIGRPVGESTIFVLDPAARPVPPGTAGELFIGGEGVARGYQGRPDLTAERFVPDPFTRSAGARLYRTGDLARFRDDGELDFLGRIDQQVKIRGVRVEPAEAEEALRAIPGVRDAAVVARSDGAPGHRLVAYVVPEADAALDLPSLREGLRRRLPEALVPAAFVRLAELPLSAHGKLDRAALPAPDEEPVEVGYEPPRDERERAIAELWAEVLGIERVGRDESFFALGGDSILSLQVTARARRRGLRLEPRQVFEHPTVAELARFARAVDAIEASAVPPAGPVIGAAPLLPIQRGFLVADPVDPERFDLALPLDLRASWPASDLRRALVALSDHHDALRSRFERGVAGWELAIAAPGAPVPLAEIDLAGLVAARQEEALAAAGDAVRGALGLGRGPLLAAGLFRLRLGERLLLLAGHHLVVDHVSWQILAEDLAAVCSGHAAGAAIALPARTASVVDWGKALEAFAASDDLAAEAAYWSSDERRRVAPLPLDAPDVPDRVSTTRTVSFRLDETATEILAAELPRAYRMQLHEGLLASLARAFAEWGVSRLLIDLEGHGREPDLVPGGFDLSRTVGWLATVTPALLDLSLGATATADALRAIKEQLRGLPRRGFGYGLLRHLRGGEIGSELGRLPVAEVLFNFAGQLDSALPRQTSAAPFALSKRAVGGGRSSRALRSHRIEINAGLVADRLEIAISHGAGHRPETVDRLARRFASEIEALSAHLAAPDSGGGTASDFPLAGLGVGDLERLARLERQIGAREIEDLYPLSPLQEGMLFHAAFAPEAGVYVAQMVCDLAGDLDPGAFAAAWRRLAGRHPALRTSFHWQGLDRALQLVHRSAPLDWREEDLSALSAADRARRLDRYLAEDRERGFDLSRPPLSRFLLIRAEERRHLLVWTFHQIQMDGWSLPILLREVAILYRAEREGGARTESLSSPRPYREYVAWLGERDRAAAEEFWRRELAGLPGPTPLPGQEERVGRSSARIAADIHLPERASAELLTAARRARVTLNTLVQAAWGLLLARTSGEIEAVFGATTAGRPAELPGVEGMVGLFINTLPVRVPVPDGESVRRWLGALQDRQAETRRWEWCPLVQIQRWSGSGGRSLFESFLVFQNYPLDRGALSAAGGLELIGLRAVERSHYPLTAVVIPGLELAVEAAWDPAALDGLAVRRALGHLAVLLGEIAEDLERPLEAIGMLGATERHQLLVEWPETPGIPRGPFVSVGRRIAAWAEKTPEAPAIRFADGELCHAELEKRVVRLAARLAAAGMAPGSIVGLCLERSPHWLVAVLAIWRVGGAFLPLDPSYPVDRLAFLAEEAEIALLLGEERLFAAVPALFGLPAPEWILLGADDDPADPGTRVEFSAAGRATDPEGLAYLIYTSGTTGRPKAVLVEHRHLEHTLVSAIEALDLRPGDSMPWVAPPSFDIALFEALAPLLLGGSTIVLSRDEVLDLDRLAAAVGEATLFHGVPSLQRRLVDHFRTCGAWPAPRRIFVGGDAVPSELLTALLATYPTSEVTVLYGPTEATILASSHRIERTGNGYGRPRGLLGRPFPGVVLRVAGRDGRPAAIGAPGELWIGGGGVARSYLLRPDLTAERFPAVDGERWYRSGDRARWLADGRLEFLGRADDQVKIRGFRIELAEIESALLDHGAVREAVVGVRATPDGERRLVAYLVGSTENSLPGGSELHSFLAERLPDYMMPAAFVTLAELPLSANGKIDRRRLPDPGFERPDLASGYVAPRDPIEERLAALWGAVLGVERVGIDDDFFELGGDSILCLQIVARARDAGLSLSPRLLFENSTIARLALRVAAADPERPAALPLLGEVAMLPVQRRFFAEGRPSPNWFAQAILLEVPRGGFNPAPLGRAVAALVAHHDALRARFVQRPEGWRQEIVPAAAIAPIAASRPALRPAPLPTIDLSALAAAPGESALASVGERIQSGFDLAVPPLFAAVAFDLGAAGRRLLLAAHHLVVDAVSWRILLEDLETAYRMASSGEAIRLPPTMASLADWAAALAALAADPDAGQEVLCYLGDEPSKPLPIEIRQGADDNASARLVAVRWSAEEARDLFAAALEAYRCPPREVLLAALSRTLARYAGGPVEIEVEAHGREDLAGLDLSRTVGWMTALHPLRLAAGGDPGSWLIAAKEALRNLPRQGLAHGAILWLGAREAAEWLAARSVPEVGFNYLGRIDVGGPAGLRLARESIGSPQHPCAKRPHTFEVTAQIFDGRLEIEWSYSIARHSQATIERLAADLLVELRAISAHCRAPQAGAYSPADFPLADLDAQGLARIVASLAEAFSDPAWALPRSGLLADLYPLTPTQEGMLFHTLLDREAYFEQVSARIEGDLDSSALRRAWQLAVDRHSILRTGIAWQSANRPLQVVHSAAELPWREEDWRGSSAAFRAEHLADLLRADRERGVDLERPPLSRITLVRLGEQEWQMVWSHHHLLLDAWARSRLFAEVVAAYEAFRTGGEPSLPPPRPFREYVAWIAGRDLSAAEAFWRRTLDGFGAPPSIGGPVRAGGIPGELFGKRELRLSPALSARLEAGARGRGLTPNTLILGAWGLLLARTFGVPAVVVGAVVAGRPAELPGVEQIVGPFLASLPVPVRIFAREPSGTWLAGLQALQAEIRHWEWTPLARIQRWIADGDALFENLYVFQNAALASERVAGSFRIAEIDIAERTDYALTATAEPGLELTLRLEFDRRRLDEPTALRRLEQWAALLGALAEEGDRPIGALDLLSPAERHQLLVEWNSTAAQAPVPATLWDLFAHSAAQSPEAPAVIAAGSASRLSYRELGARARAIARRLAALGVGPESRVGLATGRGLPLAAGLLGIFEAGAAYVPLDPGYPRERLAYMAGDSRLTALVGEPGSSERLPASDLPLILLGEDGSPLGECAEVEPTPAGPDHAAYVIYTSGSTGRPKAVVMPHRPLVHFAVELAGRLDLGPEDRILQFASPSFDVLLEELLPVWRAGGAVVMPGRDLLLAVEDLSGLLAAEQITGLELPAAYWQEWVRQMSETGFPGGLTLPASLRFMIVGSEKPIPERVGEWLRGGVPLIYVFGLTETAVTSTLHVLTVAHEPQDLDLPIGRPMANVACHLLDAEGRLAPMGVLAELYLGGIGPGRGYLDRPDLTAARFVPDPFDRQAREGGARMYRTGDLARWRSDGRLEFHGRADDQVKIRGFRVELGEVEAALAEHPDVRETVVAAWIGTEGGKRLVAYVVAAVAATPPSGDELRSFLAARLPEHMLPQSFVTLEALPLTPNGKVDRRALPRDVGTADRPIAAPAAPRTEVERTLAEIWSSVLGRAEVGIDDDFFALGGDSILSIQVTSRARRAGLAISPRDLFERPTIALLARAAAVAEGGEMGPTIGPLPLSPIQRWFFERRVADPHWFNLPVLLRPAGRLDAARIGAALDLLAERHDALRLRFPRLGEGWLGDCAPPGALAPRRATIDLAALPKTTRPRAIEGAASGLQGSFDLERGPLAAVLWFDFGAGEDDPGRLFLLAHHLIVDPVSLRVLVEDLVEIDRALSLGEPPPTPPRTTSLSQWAEALAARSHAPETLSELAFWAAPTRAEVELLPRGSGAFDPAEAAGIEGETETISEVLEEAETATLLGDLPRIYRAGADAGILAALGSAFGAWSGRRILAVDLEGHGRGLDRTETPGGRGSVRRLDVSRTVGWFAALYPLLLDLRQALAPRELLLAAKEQLRAVPGGGLGYGLLRHLGSAEARARLAALPSPEILFNYVGRLDAGVGKAEGDLPFDLAAESTGRAVSPRAARSHRFEVNAAVSEGRFGVSLGYNRRAEDPVAMAGLLAGMATALRELAAHLRSEEAGGYSPADFPLAGLSAADLDRLLGREREVEDAYPATPLQKGMLYHVLLEPEGGQYLGQLVCDLHGSLEVSAFHAAWAGLVDRHPALRTSFRGHDLAEPIQVVSRHVELPFVVEDWSGLDSERREVRFAEALDADRRRGIDPRRPPLLRWLLLRFGDRHHRLVWTFLQTNLDGWSLPLLFGEGLASYAARIEGRIPRLDPVPPFRDYVAWLRGRDEAAAEAYWRRAVGDFERPTPLPGARPATLEARSDLEYREEQVRFPAASSEALLALVRGARLTLNTAVQGLWGLLLAWWSGEPEALFGAAVSGRPAELPGVSEMVGLFLNVLPVRVAVRPEAPLLAWLRDLQAEQAEARQFEATPLSEIQRWTRVPAGRPLFETLLVVENYPVGAAGDAPAGGLVVRGLRTVEKSSYPLTLVVNPGAEIAFTFSWYPRAFDPFLIGRLIAAFVDRLARLAAHWEDRVEALFELGAAERQQLLVELCDRSERFDLEPVHLAFARQANRDPEASAVVTAEGTLSYGRLAARASAIAASLRSRSLAAEEVVSVLLPRSADLIAAQLGVLAAGGAFLPIDPDYPEQRIAYLLADSRARLLLSRRDLASRWADFSGEILALDDPGLDGVGAAPAVEEAISEIGLDRLAYVIYTSGSTGQPKGVAIDHGGLANLVAWHRHAYSLRPGDRSAPVAAPGFDASIWEIWPVLVAGAALHVPDEETRTTPSRLVEWLAGEEISVTFMPTPLAEAVLAERWPESGRLRALLTGGDRLRRGRPPGVPFALINHYGPTELSVVATAGPVPADADLSGAPTIGRQIANVRLLLLDKGLRPVPFGAVGEIHLGGRGLARGYLYAPELTAESFVPDPESGRGGVVAGARLYQTGDLARLGSDGNLEFLGRADQQVKVRGFRVELGEVEVALGSLPRVRSAVAMVREDAPGERRLVGYLATADGEAFDLAEIRAQLRRRLPEPMVPTAFVVLSELPLSPNGKVDRRSLPPPAAPLPRAETPEETPRGAVEERLSAVWREVLNLPSVGMHDDFFALGGDSILAIQVVARANRKGVRITAKLLLENPTIASLAAAWKNGAEILAEQGQVLGSVPLLPIQRWFFADDPVAPEHANQALLLEVRRPLITALLSRALRLLADHHDALRLRFRPGPKGWTQEHAAPGPEAAGFSSVDLSAIPELCRGAAVTAVASGLQSAFDLARGPLLRAVLFDFGAGRPARLLALAHHLVVDGVSWRILLEDLENAYEQLAAGRVPLMPLKTTSYQSWAERLVERLASGGFDGDLEFWRSLPWHAVRSLPRDLPGGSNRGYSSRTLTVELGVDETTSLVQALPARSGAQIQDALLAALARAFQGWIDGPLLVDVEGHGREAPFGDVDLSRTVGWFTVIYPLVLPGGDLPEPAATLEAIVALRARLPLGGLGFGLLREVGQVPDLAGLPAAELSFNYLGQLDQSLPASAPFALAKESAGSARSLAARRHHLIEVACQIAGGRLGCEWTWSSEIHREATIAGLAERFRSALVLLAGSATAPIHMTPKPADFPLLDLSQEELDEMLLDADGALRDV